MFVLLQLNRSQSDVNTGWCVMFGFSPLVCQRSRVYLRGVTTGVATTSINSIELDCNHVDL